MSAPDPRWRNVRGEITREGELTTIRLSVDGRGQRIDVATERLQRVPGLLRDLLDRMVRDVDLRLG